MRGTYRLSSGLGQASPSRQLIAFAVALFIEILLILALLGLGQKPPGAPETGRRNLGITYFPDAAPSPAPTRSTVPEPSSTEPETNAPPVTPPPVKLPTPLDRPLPILIVSHDVFAASDIAKLGSKGVPSPPGSGDDAKMAADDSEVVGSAPDGTPLYAAEWVRHPTDRELSAYLPPKAPNGFGLVACKTIANHHVQDCVELANSPPGSHLAGAVRQAAWQFLVRAPRVGGKELTGTWVRIRIDYDEVAAP